MLATCANCLRHERWSSAKLPQAPRRMLVRHSQICSRSEIGDCFRRCLPAAWFSCGYFKTALRNSFPVALLAYWDSDDLLYKRFCESTNLRVNGNGISQRTTSAAND